MSDTWGRSTFLSDVATGEAVDNFLDHVESLFTALSQRQMLSEQVERYARLLNRAEQDCLRRVDRPMRNGREVA